MENRDARGVFLNTEDTEDTEFPGETQSLLNIGGRNLLVSVF